MAATMKEERRLEENEMVYYGVDMGVTRKDQIKYSYGGVTGW